MIIKNPSAAVKTFSASTKMCVEVVHDVPALEKHVAAWQDLARHAVEPNAFYEPWMLVPGIHEFGSQSDLMFVLIYTSDNQKQSPTLCGFFPLDRKRTFRGLPFPFLRLWRHPYCHLATPLIRKNVATKTIRTFLEWLRQNHRGCPLLELPVVSGDGPFSQEFLYDFWPGDCCLRSHSRAFIRTREDADAYLMATLSGDSRRELRRRERRLNEQGNVRSVRIDRLGDHQWAIDQFLRLEASGWKGERGVAMACDEKSRNFFSEIATAGLKRRQLAFACLLLDDKPIAMTCDLLSRPGAFAFKTAFDEKYASFAPGIRLMLDHIQFIHSRPDIEWMDSCTSVGSIWMRKLWSDKKIVTSMLIPTGIMGGGLAIALFPLFRWMKHRLGRKR